MFDSFRNACLAAVIGASGAVAAPAADAATLSFVVDRDASSISLTKTGESLNCWMSGCDVSASLSSSLHDGDTYTIGGGDKATFDFVTFSGDGWGTAEYLIEATLAFSSPALSVTTTGVGVATMNLVGRIVQGSLVWDSVAPIRLSDGSTVGFSFEQGNLSAWPWGVSSVSKSVTITGIDVVPLPAGGLLLLTAIGGIAVLRRRTRPAA